MLKQGKSVNFVHLLNGTKKCPRKKAPFSHIIPNFDVKYLTKF